MAGSAIQEDSPRIDPVMLTQEERRQNQEAVGAILHDFQATVLDPISDVVPGIIVVDHDFSFFDANGKKWSFTPTRFSGANSLLTSATMKGGMDVSHSGGGQVTIEPLLFLDREGPWPLTDSFSSLRQGSVSADIRFVEKKMAELLALAKAAQAAREKPLMPDIGSGSTTDWRQIMERLRDQGIVLEHDSSSSKQSDR